MNSMPKPPDIFHKGIWLTWMTVSILVGLTGIIISIVNMNSQQIDRTMITDSKQIMNELYRRQSETEAITTATKKLELSEKSEADTNDKRNKLNKLILEYGRCYSLGFFFVRVFDESHDKNYDKLNAYAERRLLQEVSDSLEIKVNIDDICKSSGRIIVVDDDNLTPINQLFLSLLNTRQDTSCFYFLTGASIANIIKTSGKLSDASASNVDKDELVELSSECDSVDRFCKENGLSSDLASFEGKSDWTGLHTMSNNLHMMLSVMFLKALENPLNDMNLKFNEKTMSIEPSNDSK